jgi:predicted nucleotidyltransferase
MNIEDADLWLYGSKARGDSDEASDTDVLVVTDEPTTCDAWIAAMQDVSVSRYSWREVESMARYGSIFLDHVRRDGRRLTSCGRGAKRFDDLLSRLPPYQRAHADLEGFRAALADCRGSLENGGWPDYELEVVATVLRHAAILGAYCAGTPNYGRDSSFKAVGAVLGYPESVIASLQTAYYMYRRANSVRREMATYEHAAPGVLELAETFVADLEEVIRSYATAP